MSLPFASTTNKVRIFVSYDREHDGDLHDLLVAQASKSTSGFQISAQSRSRAQTDLWDEQLRSAIRESDQVIVICGEHTDCAGRVGSELRITQEEKRPYFLLWGRRELMCTKPATARSVDGMYSWTWEILQRQILTLRRSAPPRERVAETGPAWATPTS
jgi:hypothetical protein